MNAQSVLEDKSGFMTHSTKPEQPQQLSIFSLTDIKGLSGHDVLVRIDNINDAATVLRWKMLWELRSRKEYKSTNAWHDFLEEERARPDAADCAIDKKEIYRAVMAGAFCERHKLSDLTRAKVRKTAVYLLSQKGNAAVADEIFHKIRHKNTPIETVQRMIEDAKRGIEQSKAVLTIDKQPVEQTPERMEYERPEKPYTLQVESGVVQGEVVEQEQVGPEVDHAADEEMDEIERQLRTVDLKLETLKQEVLLDNEAREQRQNANVRKYVLEELAQEEAGYLTRDQQKDELKLLVKSYGLSFMAEAGLLRECAKEIAAKGYGK